MLAIVLTYVRGLLMKEINLNEIVYLGKNIFDHYY